MAVFSPTQDQGLASVRIYWSLFDVFPILWIQTWEWFGKQPCERRSRIPSPSKNSVIELKFGRFFVQFGCSKQQSGKVSHLETPHDILESFKTTSVFGGTVCVCVPWAMHCSSQGWGGCPSTSSVDSCRQFTWEFCPPLAVGQHSDTMGIACVAGTCMCIPEMVCNKNATGTWRSPRSKVALSGLLPLLDFAMVCTVCT